MKIRENLNKIDVNFNCHRGAESIWTIKFFHSHDGNRSGQTRLEESRKHKMTASRAPVTPTAKITVQTAAEATDTPTELKTTAAAAITGTWRKRRANACLQFRLGEHRDAGRRRHDTTQPVQPGLCPHGGALSGWSLKPASSKRPCPQEQGRQDAGKSRVWLHWNIRSPRSGVQAPGLGSWLSLTSIFALHPNRCDWATRPTRNGGVKLF